MKSKRVFVIDGQLVKAKLGAEIDGVWFTKNKAQHQLCRERGKVFPTRVAALTYLGEKPVDRFRVKREWGKPGTVEKVSFFAMRDVFIDQEQRLLRVLTGRDPLHKTRDGALKELRTELALRVKEAKLRLAKASKELRAAK